MEFVVRIEDDKIVSIKWNSGEIRDVNQPITTLPKSLREVFRIGTKTSRERASEPKKWRKDEFRRFYESRSDRQKAIIDVLAEKGDWVQREDLATMVGDKLGQDLTPHNLAGPLAGITRQCERMNKVRLIEREEKRVDGDFKHFYRLSMEVKTFFA